MAQIRIYRKKIKSAKNIAKITKAMQMVAASKMHKAQESAKMSRSYAQGLYDLSHLLSLQSDIAVHPLLTQPIDADKKLFIFFAPEKGLCGSLLSGLTKYLLQLNEDKNWLDIEFILVGKKAKSVANIFKFNNIASFEIGLSQPSYELVPPIARLIEERFLSGEISSVTAIFPDFINTMSQKPSHKLLLPLSSINLQTEEETKKANGQYLFEPSVDEIVNSVLSMYLEFEIYQIILESYASEQSARMVAMKNASDNAGSLIDQLTVEYNKVRQASITAEILDIGNATESMII